MKGISLSIYAAIGAVFQVLVLSSVGYILAKKQVIDRHSLRVISRLLTDVFLPAFIIYHTVNGLSESILKHWQLFPILGLIILIASMLIAWLTTVIFGIRAKRLFLATIGFQNCGYMPLIMAGILFPPQQARIIYTWIFLFLIGFNLLVWTLGVFLVSGTMPGRETIKKIFNLPFISTVIAIAIGLNHLQGYIPEPAMSILEILSRPVLPLSMLVMGGILGLNCMTCNLDRKTLLLSVIVKLLVLPLIGLLVLNTLFANLDHLLRWFILVELSVPSAVSLAVISESYGGDTPFISQVLFYTHILSIITLPIFLSM